MSADTQDDSTKPSAGAAERSAAEDGELIAQRAREGLARYGGNPELLLKEHPYRRRVPSQPVVPTDPS